MPVGMVTFAITTDSSGAGTASSVAIQGEVLEFRMPNSATAITATGGTTDWTITRATDGGTVLSLSNQNAPFSIAMGQQLFSTSAGSAIYAAGTPVYRPGVPVFGTVTITVAQGQPSKSGTVYMFYRR